MGYAHNDLAGLAQLHQLDSIDQVRALWRRGMATLAAIASEYHPVPLEGFSPSALLAGVRLALSRGFFDDLDWLSPAAAAVAMFELASALPRGDERRDLGRRVLTAQNKGDAETFIAVATALALGSRRSLSGVQVRARVALSMYMPFGLGTRADALALALISRPDSEREWLIIPSTGSLPARRLAARLIERAARETARRASIGDHTGVHIFNKPSVSQAFYRLLSDRESLVWRHVAAARGLLSNAVPAYINVIEHNLSEQLSPTEWRRAAASLTARVAIDPDETMARCTQLLYSDLLQRDSGLVAAMIYGLPCAAEAEMSAAEELLDQLAAAGDLFAIEALVDLRRERIGSEFGVRAAGHARAMLADAPPSTDDGMEALREALLDELAPPEERQSGLLEEHLIAALENFAVSGAQATYAATDRALSAAADIMLTLERAFSDTAGDRKKAFRALRDLDRGLLETNTLSDLLILRSSAEEAIAPLERIRSRLSRWLLAREFDPVLDTDIEHVTSRLRRLRTLLHLVDADDAQVDARSLRDRRLAAINLLLKRIAQDAPSPLRRTACAALARGCDAVVREDLCELSDVFIAVTMSITDRDDLAIVGEASMDPSFKRLMREYVELSHSVSERNDDEIPIDIRACLESFRALAEAVPAARTPRVEALRTAMQRLQQDLEAIHAQQSLTDLVEDGTRIADLEANVQWLARLVTGVGQRLEVILRSRTPQSGTALRAVDAAFERAVRGDTKGLKLAMSQVARAVRDELPSALAELIPLMLWKVSKLPVEPVEHRETSEPSISLSRAGMVPWLPPGRVLGGFYILRTIGKGAVGSVFIARRVEERHDESAETFALKVPEYDGTAAHTLSENEFLQLFREEARALLTLPEHPNLARFVTFDVGARPKPILVMEMVRGPTLERMLERDEFTVRQALTILDGIAAGLDAMHRVGVAHLDVKPSNIILRDSQSGEHRPALPVLVDFGLAGRKLRPGCATVHYGAPEVWAQDTPTDLEPMGTDVYAFACLAFELLTNIILFDGETAVSIVNAHNRHSGQPDMLRQLAQDSRYRDLVSVLTTGLAPRSENRCRIHDLRTGLSSLAPALCQHEWPIGFE